MCAVTFHKTVEVSYDTINRLKICASLLAGHKKAGWRAGIFGYDKYNLRNALRVPYTFQNIKD